MMLGPESLLVVVAALALDALIGDPDWLWRRMPHPIVVIGWLINALDQRLNQETWSPARRKAAGIAAVVLLVITSIVTGYTIERVLLALPAGPLWVAVVASIFIAQRSLYQHVARVAAAFATGGARRAPPGRT